MKRKTWVLLVGNIAAFLPALYIAYLAMSGGLGVNPVEKLIRETGFWALLLLVASLLVRPIVVSGRAKWLMPLRRTFGLHGFFFVLCHFLFFL